MRSSQLCYTARHVSRNFLVFPPIPHQISTGMFLRHLGSDSHQTRQCHQIIWSRLGRRLSSQKRLKD